MKVNYNCIIIWTNLASDHGITLSLTANLCHYYHFYYGVIMPILLFFSCFTELSQSISIRSGEENEDMTDFRAHFPDFLWLLRDVTLETTDKKTGKVLTATEFLKTQVLYRSKKAIPDIADNVVMCIRNYFPSIECKKLPPPTAKKEVMNNIAEREHELSPEFLTSMEAAVEYVLQEVKMKRGFNGNTLVNGSTLVDLAKQYLEAVNLPNAVPSLDLSWQSVVDAQLMKVRKALLAEYSNEMQKALKGKLPLDEGKRDDGHLNTSTLTGIHEGILVSKRARLEREMSYLLPVNMHEKLHVKSFDSRKADFLASFELQVVTYEEIDVDGEMVEQVADGLFFKFVQQNYNESVTFCTELFQQLLQPIEISIKESLKSGGKNGYTFENLQDDAENMHHVYEERARGPAKGFVFREKKESILDRHMQMYETMIGFSKDLLQARQEAFEANQKAIEARRKVDELERDIRELEQKLMLKQQELDTVRKDQERVIRELERDLSRQVEEERHRFEELSKATELQDNLSAEASKQKVQEMEEVSKQIMEEMKAEQQKRVGELAKGEIIIVLYCYKFHCAYKFHCTYLHYAEIAEAREKLDLLAAKQSKSEVFPGIIIQ